MSLTELVDVLRRGDETPTRTARDKKVAALVVERLLDPIAERARSVGLEIDQLGSHSSAKPHYISQLRLVVADRTEIIPQLRIALTQMKKEEEKALDYYVGVTVSQLSEAKGGPYPAHVRWGLWSDSPHAKGRIPGPFRLIAEEMSWTSDNVISRPMNNMVRGWLSMLGKEYGPDALDAWASFDELADQIAQDLVGLSNVMRKPQPTE